MEIEEPVELQSNHIPLSLRVGEAGGRFLALLGTLLFAVVRKIGHNSIPVKCSPISRSECYATKIQVCLETLATLGSVALDFFFYGMFLVSWAGTSPVCE